MSVCSDAMPQHLIDVLGLVVAPSVLPTAILHVFLLNWWIPSSAHGDLNIIYIMYFSLCICCILILEHEMFSSVVQVHLDLTAVSAQRTDVTL